MKHAAGRPAATQGRLVVLSGPSGAGKTTVARRLCREAGIRRSVSTTTRPPRPDEADGRDYFFVSEDEFRRRVARGDFLEHARVGGDLYGTPRQPVEEALRAGESRLLVIDVQGAMQVKASYPDALLVFLDAPDDAILRERLTGRDTEGQEEQAKRLAAAQAERQFRKHYDCCVVNDDLERTVAQLRTIVTQGRRP